jgi:hypothetical protein
MKFIWSALISLVKETLSSPVIKKSDFGSNLKGLNMYSQEWILSCEFSTGYPQLLISTIKVHLSLQLLSFLFLWMVVMSPDDPVTTGNPFSYISPKKQSLLDKQKTSLCPFSFFFCL